MTIDNSTFQSEEITITDMKNRANSWLKFILTKWKIIVIIGLVFGLFGFVLSFFSPKVYTAKLTFVLSGNDKKLGVYSSVANQFGLSIGGSEGMFQENDNIIDLFQSKTMILRSLLEKSDAEGELLADRYLVASGLKDKWSNNTRLKNIVFENNNTLLRDSVLNILYKQILKKSLTVTNPNPKSEILEINVSSIDEKFSKNYAEKLLENVSSFYIEYQTKKSLENVTILKKQVDSVRLLLNTALLGVATSYDVNPNANQAFKRLLVPSQKRSIDVEMNKAILEELVKNLELAELLLRKDTPLFLVIDKPTLPLDYQNLTDKEGIIYGFIFGFCSTILFFTFKKYLVKISTVT